MLAIKLHNEAITRSVGKTLCERYSDWRVRRLEAQIARLPELRTADGEEVDIYSSAAMQIEKRKQYLRAEIERIQAPPTSDYSKTFCARFFWTCELFVMFAFIGAVTGPAIAISRWANAAERPIDHMAGFVRKSADEAVTIVRYERAAGDMQAADADALTKILEGASDLVTAAVMAHAAGDRDTANKRMETATGVIGEVKKRIPVVAQYP